MMRYLSSIFFVFATLHTSRAKRLERRAALHPRHHTRQRATALGQVQTKKVEFVPAPENWIHLMHGEQPDIEAHPLPKLLWTYVEGDGNITEMPTYNRMCLKEWALQNPNWTMEVIRYTEYSDLITRFPSIAALFKSNPRTAQARSDMIRLAILATHGGVWVDPSLLPLKGLDTFGNALVARTGFFAFFSKKGLYTTFMASEAGNPLVVAWLRAFSQKWQSQKEFGDSELQHTLEELVREKDVGVVKTWSGMEQVPSAWPRLCLCGCQDLWEMLPEDRPPFLESPYQGQNCASFLPATFHTHSPYPSIPIAWIDSYQATLVHRERPTYSTWFAGTRKEALARCLLCLAGLAIPALLAICRKRMASKKVG
eukprot:TRINITY_DN73204_c0_g1_i1.p1 TRINITY_DN73204_c0_g1~~TRINITY_DN73204_c0_g1_i1.p1  ORF type:complete len:380 (-),score=27.81 TRINITY_DN73204_c0_g1_i1:19-1125(-)